MTQSQPLTIELTASEQIAQLNERIAKLEAAIARLDHVDGAIADESHRSMERIAALERAVCLLLAFRDSEGDDLPIYFELRGLVGRMPSAAYPVTA